VASLAASWNILAGYAGQINLGHAAFFGIGAYTSAVRGMDTLAFSEQLSSTGRSLESFGDSQLIALPGGVVVLKDGAVVGAIGVGGLPSGIDDQSIAQAGLAAMNV